MSPVRPLLAFSAALASACAERGGVAFDADPPRVRSTVPVDGASDVDPLAGLVLTFAPSACADCVPCDLDPASLEGRIAFTPALSRTPLVRLDAEACAVRISVPGGLEPSNSYALTLAPGVRDVFGNVSGAKTSVVFKTGPRSQADTTPPQLLGSWPPAGDSRLGRATPVVLFFDEEVRETAAVSAGGVQVLPSVRSESYALVLSPASEWPVGDLSLTVAKAADRVGNETKEPLTLHFRVPDSADRTPPNFAGMATLEAEGDRLLASWSAADDDASGAESIRYFVYVGRADAPLDRALPQFVTAPGATGIELAKAEIPLQVAVRAQDEAGNLDANVVVRVQP